MRLMTDAGWADVILAVHFAYAAGVVLPLPYVLLGWSRGWPLTRSNWFRALNLALVVPVLLELVLGRACPLTMLGDRLRSLAGQPVYGGGCVDFWLGRLLGRPLPGWLLNLLSLAVAIAVPVLYFAMPPDWLERRRRRRSGPAA